MEISICTETTSRCNTEISYVAVVTCDITQYRRILIDTEISIGMKDTIVRYGDTEDRTDLIQR